MQTFLQDLRFGLRMLAKNPGFTAVAVTTLALGIGANSAIFSLINSTLLNPIPGATRTSEIVFLTQGVKGDFSYLDYVDLRGRNRSLSGLTAFSLRSMDLTDADNPQRVWGSVVSTDYFDVLGTRPILGRGFLPEEEEKPGGAPVAVISYRLWQARFGGNDSALGRIFTINRHPYTVVGVAPAAFQGSRTGLRSDLWVPLAMQQQIVTGDRLHDRGDAWLGVQGRLRPGVTREQAQQEMNLLMRQLAEQFPDSHQGANDVTLYPLWRAPYGANHYLHTLLPVLLAIAGVVLLLACANVANLLLVRSVTRRREIAIRLSLGASRARLVRQLLVESLLLALGGGGIAMLLTVWTSGGFAEFMPATNVPISLDVRTDRTVLLASIALSIFTVVIFGMLPALRSTSVAPASVLKEEAGSTVGGLRRSRLSSGLVVAQISLSLLLLICSGLFIRSFRAAQRFDPGFDPDHVLLASFDLFPAGYASADGAEFHRQLLAKLQAIPGMQSVTLASGVPLSLGSGLTTILPEGYVPRPDESIDVGEMKVGPNYLRTMRIPLLAGREFDPHDTERSAPVAIVNQALADRYWPHQDPLSKRIYTEGLWFSVVGVAGNSKYSNLNESPQPLVYLPLFQDYHHLAVIHARVAGDPLSFALTVEEAVHELHADLPVFDVGTLRSRIEISSVTQRVAGWVAGAFGLLSLVLAAVGIYGVIAYTTRQRTREIGIRMALGARRGNVLHLVLGQALRMLLIGVGIGLALSFGLTRFLRSQLFGVTSSDALTYGSAAALLCGVALLACYVPARRATKVDPVVTLRYE
jgi:predicted permease